MGICIENKNVIKKEVDFGSGDPIAKDESDVLYSYESALCKIVFEAFKNGKTQKCSGTGFFCEINDMNIPFRKALFTNNHVLDENSIKINKQIEFEYCGEKKIIEITKNRKVFTNEDLDYTCIEILDIDKITKFFNIDQTVFENKNSLKYKDIVILQYPHGNLSIDKGKIIDINNNIIKHKIPTQAGSSGSPLIRRYNINFVIGIHYGVKQKEENEKSIKSKDKSNFKFEYNLATPFDVIIKDVINKLTININQRVEYRKTINLIYNKKNEDLISNIIFSSVFVKNNKDNITLIINGKKSELINVYNLQKGRNNIQMIIHNQLTNLESMFSYGISLENIEELKYLNTEKVSNFSYMFFECTSLLDIKPLENWNVSNGNNFSKMFFWCKLLSDIKPLQNWNVSNGNNFSSMFSGCESLSDIKPLENWNVSNGNNFSSMFSGCKSLSDIKPLENWNVSNGNNFAKIFFWCSSLSDIKPLENWNVSNGNEFSKMFFWCKSLSDIKPLENWNVSNGNNYSEMLSGCESLSDIKPLQNWDVSNGNNFSSMFSGCKSLSDIKPLENWNVSNGNNFSKMFFWCESLSDIKPLENWNVSNGNDFSKMFFWCKLLSDIKPLENWNVSNGNNFSEMFRGCESLSDIKPLQNWNVSNKKYLSYIRGY